jgi:hypothetical protein
LRSSGGVSDGLCRRDGRTARQIQRSCCGN